MTSEKNRARLTRIAKQWAATLVGSRHVSSSEVATLAEMLEPLLITGSGTPPAPELEATQFDHHPTCSRRGGTSCFCRAPVAARVDDKQTGEPVPEAELQAAITASRERLHWPFTVKHENCAGCDREYEPIPAHLADEASPIVAQDARALVEQWALDHDDEFIIGQSQIEVLAQRITTLANQRYVEGVEAAARQECVFCAGVEGYNPLPVKAALPIETDAGNYVHRNDPPHGLAGVYCKAPLIRALLNEEKRDG